MTTVQWKTTGTLSGFFLLFFFNMIRKLANSYKIKTKKNPSFLKKICRGRVLTFSSAQKLAHTQTLFPCARPSSHLFLGRKGKELKSPHKPPTSPSGASLHSSPSSFPPSFPCVDSPLHPLSYRSLRRLSSSRTSPTHEDQERKGSKQPDGAKF